MKVTSGDIGAGVKVDAYFDYASPWSYLASEIAVSRLPGVELRWRPIYLRGLEMFATGVPYAGPKLAYSARDLTRCCEHEGVPFVPPVTFPVDGLHALRAAIVAEERGVFARYHELAFRAETAREVADWGPEEVVCLPLYPQFSTTTTASSLASWQRAATQQGLLCPTRCIRSYPCQKGLIDALVASFSAPNVKERLKADTAAAVERGVFGVPSFFVGDEMFWGHDRLDYVARAAAGA